MSAMMKIQLLETWGRHKPGLKEFFRPVARMLIGQGLAREVVPAKQKGKSK